MDQITFTCACCGKTVEGLPDLAFDMPIYCAVLSEEERRARTTLTEDLCSLDGEHFFVRGVCKLPVEDSDRTFSYGVWVSLQKENFERFSASIDEGKQSSLGAMFGWLSNRIPGYPDTLNLQTGVEPQDDHQRPFVWISDAHSDHPLYAEQRNGISLDRLGEIYARNLCEG